MKKIIVIVGPTGIGKTTFAIKTAKKFNGEIVGADSMQIYKYLNIGTAKPDENEIKLVKHHLVDFLDPREEFDAGAFVTHADRVISDITGRKKVPVVVGGTGLYVRALINGLFRSQTIDEKVLEQLSREIQDKGKIYMHQRLQACDPAAAENIHPNDTFRVIRALEVFLTTGRKISDRHKEHCFNETRYDAIKIGLHMNREELYQRINTRVDLMVEQGLLSEVGMLVEKGFSLDLKAMQSIGYKQMGLFLKGEVDWNEALRLLKRDTRRYAKRQMTWFTKDPDIHWVKPNDFSAAMPMIKDFFT